MNPFAGARVFNAYPFLSRFVALILLPLACALLYADHLIDASRPSIEGKQIVHGVSASVRIARDSRGVPTIEAHSDQDAFFAIGYVHAQERLWQMELLRRTANGRLGEVLGRGSVRFDVFFRILGVARAAGTAWKSLSPQAQASLQAYAAGVNAWVATTPVLPIEFRLLGVRPEPWTPEDSLAEMKLFALSLGLNYEREINNLLVVRLVGPQRLQLLLAAGDEEQMIPAYDSRTVEALLSLQALQQSLTERFGVGGPMVGSNAWVVSGAHTVSGSPMLANDPHLGLQIPSLWFALRARGSDLDVAGMSLAGVPFVVLGRNTHVAWGATSLMADVQDLYLEQIDAADSGKTRYGTHQELISQREEVIHVHEDFPSLLHKPLRPVTINVRTTIHGPIISDGIKEIPQPVALKWVALDPQDTSYEAFFRMNYARDWGEFERAAALLVAPALNLLYADTQGNIAYLAAGRIPIRGKGDGLFPAPGWDESYAWTGYVPPEKLPRSVNPSVGFIVSANNKVVGREYPYLISREWAPEARALRITALLREKLDAGGKLSLNDMRRMQADVVDLQAKKLLPLLLAYTPRTPQQAAALRFLSGWNGEMSAHSVSASIFKIWQRYLSLELVRGDLKADFIQRDQVNHLRALFDPMDADILRRALDGAPGWCEVGKNTGARPCEEALSRSLDASLLALRKITGTDHMEKWRLDRIQQASYENPAFTEHKILGRIYNRRVPGGGSSNSINVATTTFDETQGFLQTLGPTFRQIMDVSAAPAAHWFMNSTGQSGSPIDTHYDDMIEPYRKVEYEDLGDSSSRAIRELRIVPGQP
jgi:penicillin amidase